MIIVKSLSDEQAKQAIGQNEFDAGTLDESPYVAVLMTQDWCSQWNNMESWLNQNAEIGNPLDKDCTIYTLIYNKKPYFHEFMSFKETVWKNDRVPYIRYYKNGAFLVSSNFVSKEQFFRNFNQITK